MLTFRRLALVTALAALSLGCERQSASTDVDADIQTTTSQGLVGSTIGAGTDPLRPIFGRGDFGFIPMFVGAQSIANSGIFQSGHRIIVGGTEPAARFQVQDAFTGVGNLVELHQVEPTGDITLEFSQAPLNPQDVMGNIGVVRSRDGKPERFVVVGAGSNPRKLPLVLAEDAGNVGIGLVTPLAKLDVLGDLAVRGTGNTCCALHVQNDFAGFGTIASIHQVNPTGDISLEFSQSGFGVMGNVGVIRSSGGPERFVILGAGRNPRNLSLALVEDGGNVGIGTADPRTKLDVVGNTSISGNLSVTGTKSSVATLSDGRRVLLYAVESPKNWFEDFGTAKLQRGEAWVPLEPVFGETVNTADTYHVFLTPSGDCKGLYIAERRADGFLVRELGGGRSTVSFDYRIVAPRRGFETVRLSELP